LDKAAEAIRVLNDTRDLWTATWDKAAPVPASEQHPLFDPESTLEMALDYLETIHPATLLGQVLAVNLSAAYASLSMSAGEAAKIGPIRRALEILGERVESALQVLSSDVIAAVTAKQGLNMDMGTPSGVTTVGGISACEQACIALSEAEVLISRATSLLSKLPGQFQLVERLLQRKDDDSCTDILVEETKSAALAMISKQQRNQSGLDPGTSDVAEPTMREYLFRSSETSKPCQLVVRYGNEQGDDIHDSKAFMALAMATCRRS
jgi:hypothetical protein